LRPPHWSGKPHTHATRDRLEDRQDPTTDKLKPYGIEENDPRWSVLVCDMLEHLLDDRKDTCIEWFNLVSDPNGQQKWGFWNSVAEEIGHPEDAAKRARCRSPLHLVRRSSQRIARSMAPPHRSSG
jgi:hypothetical protein